MAKANIVAEARDVVLMTLEHAPLDIRSSTLVSRAAGVSRAFQVRGAFPRVRGNRLEHGGDSRHSELFAGEEPRQGSVSENLFVSWLVLWQNLYADEDALVFDRRYGSSLGRNRIEYGPQNGSGDEPLRGQ